MGMIILPILLLAVIMFFTTLYKTVKYIKKEGEYRPLVIGLFLALTVSGSMLFNWHTSKKIYAFDPVFEPAGWYIPLGFVSFIVSFFKNKKVIFISRILSAALLVFMILSGLILFNQTAILKLLSVKTHY